VAWPGVARRVRSGPGWQGTGGQAGPLGSGQGAPDHPPRPAGFLGRASPAGLAGRSSPAGHPHGRGQPAACRRGCRGSRRRPPVGPPADHGVM